MVATTTAYMHNNTQHAHLLLINAI